MPQTDQQFVQWARTHLDLHLDERAERMYNMNVLYAQNTAQSHPFFANIESFLRKCDDELGPAGDPKLLMGPPQLILHLKSYESFVNKLFRENVVWNKNFPDEPSGGWVTLDNAFSRLNDIVRGTIVCKYIDGPRVLADQMSSEATRLGLISQYKSQQKDTGYYAYHFYVTIPMDLIDISFGNVSTAFQVEIQLTTQLQDILYKITHRFYDQTRSQIASDPHSWKWEITSNRFKASYMAHTLHMLEATIAELRDQE